MTESAETPKRGRRAADPGEAKAPARLPIKRVKITAYKVYTRHGRFIEGQFVELPADEADALIAEGKAA